MEIFIVLLFIVGVVGAIVQHLLKKKDEVRLQQEEFDRKSRIAARYSKDPLRDDILGNRIRPGMTVQQLVDAWGPPAAIDERVLKTKVVHTYKYAQTGARTFRQKVKVENGIVVGWTNT